MKRGMTKAERLRELEHRYLQRAYSDIEMGEIFDVDRTTIYRDRRELMAEIPFVQDTDDRWRIDRTKYLSSIRVNLQENLSLYLAARRLSQQTQAAQQPTASALGKLALTLRQPMTERLVKAAESLLTKQARPENEAIFEAAAQAWVEQHKLRIHYRGLRGKESYGDMLSTYLIEPSPWSDSVYLIGYSEKLGKITPYRLDRIERAFVSGETFAIPDGFDEEALLRYAWGIWRSDKAPQTVRLRFTGGAAVKRLKESVWHPLEAMEELDNGAVLWEAPIAEPREMLPWIRGWGADVEVLAPQWLRERLMREAQSMAALYGVLDPADTPLYQRLWAKTSRDKAQIHPLICHLLDVAQVTLALWQYALTDGLRSHFANALQLGQDEAGRTIAFWAGLHDLGKASPGFQRKYAPAQEELTAAGLSFPRLFTQEPCYHATITTCTLPDLLCEETETPKPVANAIAQALGGHHGTWPTSRQIQATKSYQIGGENWQKIRRKLVQTLRNTLSPAPVARIGRDPADKNAFLALFSGLVSVADWIGSMEEQFPFAITPLKPEEYVRQASEQAEEALRVLHWTDWQPAEQGQPFEKLFPFAPNELQQAIIGLTAELDEPSLVIIEAPTGRGKTEAALYLAEQWSSGFQQRGLYVAMPTMATSNQMHGRTAAFLSRSGSSSVEPLLIHSQVRWMKQAPPPQLRTEEESDGGNTTQQDMGWFLPRKRSLLAPFGVGTVDQALLSVLQTRHFFVRLFALGHKTVIFDEIHAYDTYMSHLFQRLLHWLRAANASVVLLSATLPARTRTALIRAYLGDESAEVPAAPYPSVTWACGNRSGTLSLSSATERTIALHKINRAPETIRDTLEDLLGEGGCAAVICNTVARAQEVFRILQKTDFFCDEELILFHARTPLAWRDETERKVLSFFGKEGDRPERAVVVATQVIEQSLDLDFDVIITDLPPIDLLLQRAGRLQRHDRSHRPVSLTEPMLFVAIAAGKKGVPDFANDVHVYESYHLLRSYLVLTDRDSITIPDDTEELIESVYGDDTGDEVTDLPAMRKALGKAETKMRADRDKERFEAEKRLVESPDYRRLLRQSNDNLQEDSLEVHEAFQALTRLGRPTIPLVCLHQVGSGLYTDLDGNGRPISLAEEPDPTTTEQLAQHTVNVSHQGIVHYLLQQESPPDAWREHPLLKNYYLAVFNDGVAQFEGLSYRLHLSREYGLEIEKYHEEER